MSVLCFFIYPFSAAPAQADHTFCESGSGAGQCQRPLGVAVDAESGRVYVADEPGGVIRVFDEDGGPEGTIGEGVLIEPVSVSVDNDPASPTQHEISVTDEASRVLRFDPAGVLRLGFGWGVRDGMVEAQTCGPDATPASGSCLVGLPGKGECQLVDHLTARSKVAIGPGGSAYVADNVQLGPKESEGFKGRVEVFGPDGGCEDEHVVFEGENRRLNAIAVDSGAGAYVSVERLGGEIRRLDPAGALACTIDPGATTTALAVDPASDRLYAGQAEAGYLTLTIYEPGCSGETYEHARRFGYTLIGSAVRGIGVLPGALDPSREGEAALSENGGAAFHLGEPPAGPILVPGSLLADSVGNTEATLGAEINPEGEESEIAIEYVEKATCEEDEAGGGECFDQAVSSGVTTLEDDGFVLVGAEALFGCPDPLSEDGHPGETAYEAGECLEPETTFRFAAAASNPEGPGNSPVDGGEFTTLPWLELGPAWASAVGTGSARLSAEVNPLGVPVSAHFEVVDEPTCEADEAGGGGCFDHAESTAVLDFGSGEGLATRGVSLGGLEPGQSYRYRLLAANPLMAEAAIGEARSFTTFEPPAQLPCPANAAFRTGPGALLPDCRGYELVSPLDKDQADIAVLLTILTNTPAVLEQSSVSGSRFAYGSLHAFGDAASAPYTSAYIAERRPRGSAEEGWRSHSINPPIDRLLYDGVPSQVQAGPQAFSPDLCVAWTRGIAEPALAPGAQAGYPNLYRRTDGLCGGPAHEALSSSGWENLGPAGGGTLGLELQGVSADGQRAAFVAPDSLEGSDASDLDGGKLQLYVWERAPAGGTSTPVFACILPNGTRLAGPCSAGRGPGAVNNSNFAVFARLQGALSASGQRLFWTAGEGDGKIYMRERPALGRRPGGECGAAQPCTIAVSAAGEALSGEVASQFRAAAADGSKAIYTTGSDLYEAQIEEEGGHPVLDATEKIAGGIVGVMGASEDASHVYFASTEAIGGSGTDALGRPPEPGDRNLYLHREGDFAFIGALEAGDMAADKSALAAAPVSNLARVTGEHAAFVSSTSLTGYDNTDVASGEPDTEVFLYDAAAGELHCASCNPSGARPAGRDNTGAGPGPDRIMFAGPDWIASWLEGHENTLYTSRELSADGGRLFFNSTDALVARDTNGRADVYQWEAPGKGSCTEGAPSYSPRNGGCVDLISSGQSARDSTFLDASPGGEDVFFTTLSNLVPADYDLIDVYDARVGGGFPPPPPPATECEGEACQSPPPAPAPANPASAAFRGPGDLAAPAPASRCAKAARRAKALAARAKSLRGKARRSKAPGAKRKRLGAAKRNARAARKQSRSAKRCRARARAGARR